MALCLKCNYIWKHDRNVNNDPVKLRKTNNIDILENVIKYITVLW